MSRITIFYSMIFPDYIVKSLMVIIKQLWQLFSLYDKITYSNHLGQKLMSGQNIKITDITILLEWAILNHLLSNFAFCMDLSFGLPNSFRFLQCDWNSNTLPLFFLFICLLSDFFSFIIVMKLKLHYLILAITKQNFTQVSFIHVLNPQQS